MPEQKQEQESEHFPLEVGIITTGMVSLLFGLIPTGIVISYPDHIVSDYWVSYVNHLATFDYRIGAVMGVTVSIILALPFGLIAYKKIHDL